MCGIVGYAGGRVAHPLLLESLERLEYRGYDSAGLASVGDDLYVVKVSGRIEDLRARVEARDHATGVGHTRWATHGPPTETNAHPHTDCEDEWAVVHNGIIENHLEVRRSLEGKGHSFRSDTDTEIVPHLLEEHADGSPEAALHEVRQHLEGSWAICAVTSHDPGRIVAARQEAPLVIGVGDGETFLASDIPALLTYTRRFVYLEDGEIAVITADGFRVLGPDLEEVDKEIEVVDWSWEDAEKGGFAHFMLKEIHETPRAVQETLLGRVREGVGTVDLADESVPPGLLDDVERIRFVACGTSYHACLTAKYAIEALAGTPVGVEIASEYRYSDLPPDGSLVVAVSQSGETADTLAAVREAKRKDLDLLGITNVPGSTLTREADGHLLMRAGPEIGVAATKTFLAQLGLLYALGVKLGRDGGQLSPSRTRELLSELRRLPRTIQRVLDREEAIADHADRLAACESCLYIGRHINFPSALEGALKLKEISYIHAEGYPAGELKHGPFALLDEEVPVVALVPDDHTYEKMVSNVGEIKARDAPVIAVADEDDRDLAQIADGVISIPETDPLLTPVPIAVALQLLAYHVGVQRGCPVDKPRNLAKSVTVE